MIGKEISAVEQLLAVLAAEARTGWRTPTFWATVATLVAACVGVAWPGFADPVKAAVGAGGALVVAVYTATRHQVTKTALALVPPLEPPSPPPPVGGGGAPGAR
ncbi:MAG TPA: hypothetical protein VFD01_17025 [Candidatus Dormibacteraeota bacterium]|nr:hypothetical protein [Candidatus Dormibacteraeota bacterium]